MDLLTRCILTAISALAISLLIMGPSLYAKTEFTNTEWITLVVSAGIGVIIALIVHDRATSAHQEVIDSQKDIETLIGRLNETDTKHNEALTKLQESRQETEKISFLLLSQNLIYVSDLINKMEKILTKSGKIKAGEKNIQKLFSRVLPHFESPLNLLSQSAPHIVSKLSDDQRSKINDITEMLRKFTILVTLETDYDAKSVLSKLIQENKKIKKLMDELKISKNMH